MGSCLRPRLLEAVTVERGRGLPRLRLLRLLPPEHLRLVREGEAVVGHISGLVDHWDADSLWKQKNFVSSFKLQCRVHT
jgi:hypothetical protein